ncbi:MAG: hypothetical protein K8J31_30865 [Anaerolineae bacterium]|nr:hypothetical protein [Anaerolineae bacterium]
MNTLSTRRRWRTRILAVVVIPLILVLCVGGATVALDSLCYSGLTQRLPLYPGAVVTFEKHNGLRRFGMGETLMILESADPIETVRDWYGRNAGAAVRRMQQDGQRLLISMSQAEYSVVTAEDGQGTQITLSGVCGG